MEAHIRSAVQAWLTDPNIAEADRAEIRALLEAGDERELADRFYRDLEFGTGGLRGVIGAGRNRMNVYTVGAAAAGLATYLLEQGDAARRAGVAIAFDCRRCSDVFALRTACVLAGHGIPALLFRELRPTPLLSFAVRHLGCAAGVVITASHNPPEYNGLKVYWSDGVQIVPPHDADIIARVRAVGNFGRVPAMDAAAARRAGLIREIGPEVDEAFLQAVQDSCLDLQTCRRRGATLKIVYTSLHGTGGTLIPQALQRRGFRNVIEVPGQCVPDGGFPTVASPNPEEPEALSMAVALAARKGADLVIGTDPDADRMGVAVRDSAGGYPLLTGNQIAALLTDYIFGRHAACGTLPSDALLVTTLVSGGLMKAVARSYGAGVVEVLTGFKWIGQTFQRCQELRAAGRPAGTCLFGAEESYGYMPCTHTRDKDAVSSAAFIAEAAAAAAERGKTLHEVLEELYHRHGYFQEGARNLTLTGPEGAQRIRSIMTGLRSDPPRILGGIEVRTIGDLADGRIRDVATGRTTGSYDLPSADVLVFTLADGTQAIARPSGTEPKIKFYVLTRVADADLQRARAGASARIAAVADDLVRRAG